MIWGMGVALATFLSELLAKVSGPNPGSKRNN